MKQVLFSLFTISILSFISCGGANTSTAGSGDLTGYELTAISGSSVSEAIKKNTSNAVAERGYVANGKKNGVWMTYHEDGKIKTLSGYSDGLLNGPHLEFNNRGQIEKQMSYQAGQYHGVNASYKFGRPTKESTYKNGKLDGPHKEYNQKGDLQKYVDFKDGKQHGKLRYYDDEGNITLEYDYKNGDKVSGGIVEKKDEN